MKLVLLARDVSRCWRPIGATRWLPLLVVVVTAMTRCPPAQAAPSDAADAPHVLPGDEALRLDQLGRLLATVDEEASARTFWLGATNVTVGAASLAAGSFAAGRGSVGPAIVTFVGGGVHLASGILELTLERARSRSLYAEFLARRESKSAAVALGETERSWQAAADSARTRRLRSGVVLTTVGALLVGFSAGAMVTNLALPSKRTSDGDRASFDGALLGLSGLLLIDGVAVLVVPGPIESGWKYSRTMSARVEAPRASFQITPVRQGAEVGLTIAF